MDKQLLDSLNNLSLSLVEISNSLNKAIDSKSVGSTLVDSNFSNQMLAISNSILDISNVSTSILRTQENLIKNQETILNILRESDEKFNKIKSKLNSIDRSQKSIIELGKESTDGISNLINDRSDDVKNMGESIIEKITHTETIKEIGRSVSELKESIDRNEVSNQKSHIETIREITKIIKESKTDSRVESKTDVISEIGNDIKEIIRIIKRFKIGSKVESKTDTINEIINSINESEKDNSKVESRTETIKEIAKESQISDIKNSKVESRTETIKEIAKESQISDSKNSKVESRTETIKQIAQENPTTNKKTGPRTETIKEIGKESKEIGFFGKMKDNIKDIKTGVSTILLIASGVLAIGLAFKVIGQVDFASIISLSIALPLIALAFHKISQIGLDPSGVKNVIISIVGISTAIALSSFILSTVRPISLAQSLTSILIAGTFSIIGFGISKFLLPFKGIDNSSLIKSSFILPLLMVGISAAIAGSSHLLGLVKPIGLFQAITSIMIAGVFATIGFGMSGLISAFKGIDSTTAIKASIILPISMISISAAIAGSSYLLGLVKPIGLFQALTSILIAGVFTTISFGLSHLIRSFRGVSITDAIKASAMIPIVMIAMSAAIAGSSYLLGLVKPIGLFQALTSILIAGVFTVISYGATRLIKGFKDISPGDALKASLVMPIVLVALSGAIMASSHFLSMVKPIGLFQAITSILISGIFVVLSYTIKPLLSGLKGVSYGDILKGGIILLALTGTIVAASHIIGSVKDLTMSQVISFIGIGISLGVVSIAFGGAIKILNKIGGPSDFIKGGISIIAISGAIALSSIILGMGDYTSYPSVEWALNSGLSLAMFAIGAVLLGSTAMTPMFWVGLGAVVVTSLAITAVSHILGMGDYTKYPSLEWSLNSGLSLAMFGIGAVLIGTTAMTPMFWVGLGAIVVTALTVTATSHIIGMGDYTKYPDLNWSLGVGLSIAGFGLGATLLGFQAINPLFYAGLGVILLVAGAIVGVSYILGSGDYSKAPPIGWALSVGSLIAGFGLGAAALGLVSPLVLLGLLAATAVAGTIWLIDEIFTSGSFKKYPSDKWVSPTISIVGKFGMSMIGLAFALPLIALGSISTLAVVGTIVLIDKAFSSGKYTKYPSKTWTSGVFTTLKDMSNLLSHIRNNLGFGDLALGAIKIWGVIKSLKMIDESLSGGKFLTFPSSTWNQGVKTTLISMMDLMSIPSFITVMRDRVASLFGGGLSDIANTIVTIDKIFSLGKYGIFPNNLWVKGVVSSISEFIKLGDSKSIISSIGDIIKSGLGSSLEDIAHKIVSIDKILSMGKFNKFPSLDWSKSILSTIKSIEEISNLDIPEISDSVLNKLSSISSKVSSVKILPLSNIPDSFMDGINSITSVISKILSIPTGDISKGSKFIEESMYAIKSISSSTLGISYSNNLPPKEWASGIKSLMMDIGSIMSYTKSIDISQGEFEKIDNLVRMSNEISRKISMVEYPTKSMPKIETERLVSSISLIGNSLSEVNKISLDQISLNRSKLESVVDSIIFISQSFVKLPTTYPSEEWTSGTSKSIEMIGKSFMTIDSISINVKEKSSILSTSVVEMMKSLSGTNTNINLEWIDKFSSSITRIFDSISSYPSLSEIQERKNRIGQISDLMVYLKNRISGLSDISIDNINLDSSISSLERMSIAFDKISRSVDGFVNSIENINSDKISSVGTITNSMILLNTVGEKQFEKIIQRIEERSDRLTEAINNYNRDKSDTEENQQPRVSSPSLMDNKIEIPEMKSLVEKVETMTALLADISSVVGSRGALKNYIMSIQGEVTIGKKT